MATLKKFWQRIGPGVITGASDDEPSGIATYTIAGAKFGLATLWMSLFTLPLMIAIQEMSARIGRISGHGLVGNMRRFYPKGLLFFIALLIVSVNTINIGADMSGMAQSIALILPFNEKLSAITITLVILVAMITLSYKTIFTIFKWLSLSLLSYIFAVFTINIDWLDTLKNLFTPQIHLNKEFLAVLIAFFGTTVSPYLFFWQANQEVEERLIEQCKPGKICRLKPVSENELKDLRFDTRIGMTFSNVITFFIIVLTASTLYKAGFRNIESLKDAAEALRPLAGPYAYELFTLGIVSSGFLAIPVLAGSAAYVIGELFGWSVGLNKTFTKAKEFYIVIICSTLVGLIIPILGIHPVKALFYTSILFGAISPIIIFMIIHMANNRKIMGPHANRGFQNFMGYLSFTIMAFLSLSLFLIF